MSSEGRGRADRGGPFGEWFNQYRVYRLRECPLCARDPDRERHFFARGERTDEHFEHEHGPDDVGRPIAELLPPVEPDL